MHTLAVLTSFTGLAVALVLGGCANAPPLAKAPRTHASHPSESNLYSRGIVQSIDLVVLNTVANTHIVGPDAAPTTDAFKFTILMQDRSYQTVVQTTHGDLRVGDRVQVSNGVVRRY